MPFIYPDVPEFIQGYIECALWTSEETLADSSVSDFAESTVDAIRKDCEEFQRNAAAEIAQALELGLWTENGMGHDFWLTRNGHGAGFWDRHSEGIGDELGDKLTELSKTFKSVDLYSGDDGKIYQE